MNQIELPFMTKQSANAEVQEAGYSPLRSVWDGEDSELLESIAGVLSAQASKADSGCHN
jgi:hypothetical protein